MESAVIKQKGPMPVSRPGGQGVAEQSAQTQLWQDVPLATDGQVACAAESASLVKVLDRKTIQDVLFSEGLLAVRASLSVSTLTELQESLVKQLGQNSMETRVRYAQSIIRWFFPDGLDGLARRVWVAYGDERIETDILRYLYVTAEPVIGTCVAEALYPLENGMQIPSQYFDQFLKTFFGESRHRRPGNASSRT